MSENALIQTPLAAEGLQKMAAGLMREASKSAPSGDGGTPFLKFNGETGTYTLGKEKIEVPLGTVAVLVPQTATAGFIAFRGLGQKPERVVSTLFGGEEVQAENLPALPAGAKQWSAEVGVMGALIEGAADDGKEMKATSKFIFNLSSQTGPEKLRDIFRVTGQRIAAGETEVYLPVVALDRADSFPSKSGGGKPIFPPRFPHLGWASAELQFRSMEAEAQAALPDGRKERD